MTKYQSQEEKIAARRVCQIKYMKQKRERQKQEKIDTNTVPKRGRPAKYETDEQRLEAKRKQVCQSVLRLYYKKKEEQAQAQDQVDCCDGQ